MAQRLLYIPNLKGPQLVTTQPIDFQWFPGMAMSQKRKSIEALQDAARTATGLTRILEVSTKSEAPEGVAMSGFNLMVTAPTGRTFSVECAFEASKVFAGGGPYLDILATTSLKAKRDPRLQTSGELVAYEFFGHRWPLEPETAFYDWLYVNALRKEPALIAAARAAQAFTDIELNPAKVVNCQAYAAALYVALEARGWLDRAVAPEDFLALVACR